VKNPQKREKSTNKNKSTKKKEIHKKEINPQKRKKSTKKKEIHKKEERGEIWYPLQIVWIKVNFMYLLEV
jgi:hypothetical protein